MIEIAFDQNNNHLFKNQTYPVFTLHSFNTSSFSDYLKQAENIIYALPDSPIIILPNTPEVCSVNFLALALFIKSCLLPNKIECVVFKTTDSFAAMEKYKPFVALTTAIRLAVRLCNSPSDEIYREIKNMGYLGLDIKTDYIRHFIKLSLGKETDGSHKFTADTISEAIVAAATLKTLALSMQNISAIAEINISQAEEHCKPYKIIVKILQNTIPLLTTENINL